jgi:epoxide hydrolase-like predicted phosphatase
MTQCPMTIKAVVFDIGDVLERVGDETWLQEWRPPDMSAADLDQALAGVDPDSLIPIGGMSEQEYLRRYADALRLDADRFDAFAAAMWDWYCGELDTAMVEFAASLRPRCRTAILSNSSDGARREEQARWGFEDLVDSVVYSHEVGLAKPDPRIYRLVCERLQVAPDETILVDDVPANVDSAHRLGIHGVLHRDTAATIAAVNALLAGS